MSNRYAGICYRCGGVVNPGRGVFERTSCSHERKWPGKIVPKWLTQHHSCAKKYRGTSVHYQFFPDKNVS